MPDKQHIFYDILDKKRLGLLPLFDHFKDRFCLAGGTALALRLGHRDSIDFDFFTWQDFDAEELLREIKGVFAGHSIEIIQAGNKTLNLIIDDEVKASFFCIKEKLLFPTLELEFLKLASLQDIACMKIVALLRAQLKDYVDLFYLFKNMSLEEIFNNCHKKYERFDEVVYLKALVSFDDIEQAEILFEKRKLVTLEQIKADFQRRVNEYVRKLKA